MSPEIDVHPIREEMEQAGHGLKKAVVRRHAERLGVSENTVYRALAREFGKSKTVERPKIYPQELVDRAAAIKLEGMRRGLSERELATELVIDRMIEEGFPGAEALRILDEPTGEIRYRDKMLNARLAEAGFRIRDPRVRVRARLANRLWQIDFSRSKYFQLYQMNHDNGRHVLKASGRELHYKQEDRSFRTWLAQVKDDFSSLRLARAYAATGESGPLGLEFLNFCWLRPEDDHPMRFLPDILKSDQGAFAKSKPVKNAMRALEIEMRLSKPYNKESQGKVESGWRVIWRRFELPLSLRLGDGATICIDDYNVLMHEFLAAEQSLSHPSPVLKGQRGALYRESLLSRQNNAKHPLRKTDRDILELACKIERRKVSDQTLMVQYPGGPYEAPVYAMNKWIWVYRNYRGEVIGELMEGSRGPFPLRAFRERDLDDFRNRPHQTYRQKIEQEAAPVEPYREGKRVFMPAVAETVTPDSPFAAAPDTGDAFGSVYKAKIYIGGQIRQMTGESYAEYADVFDQVLEESLSRAHIDAFLDQMRMMVREENMGVAK